MMLFVSVISRPPCPYLNDIDLMVRAFLCRVPMDLINAVTAASVCVILTFRINAWVAVVIVVCEEFSLLRRFLVCPSRHIARLLYKKQDSLTHA